VENVCIKPEFEILHIIYNNKYENFNKEKSNSKPSNYINLIIKDYKKTHSYNYRFFQNLTNEELITLINNYDIKRLGAHNNEKSLKYLINSED